MEAEPNWQELCHLVGIEPELLNEYELRPRRIEQLGNAIRVTADGATVYIKRMREGYPDFAAVHQLTERLARQGVRVPRMLPNKYGDPYVRCETGDVCVLPRISGRAVQLGDEAEFVEAARALGAWHRHAAAEPGLFAQPLRADLAYWWGLARVKLNSYRECALDRPQATELDELFLVQREDIDRQIARALAYLPLANYRTLCERAWERGELCHGNVVRQNLLHAREGVYVLDHSHVYEAPQVLDLASYVQRYAARFDWDRNVSEKALAAYQQERPLFDAERVVLAVLFAYPAGVLRILEYYYEQRRDWDEEDFVDAFEEACEWDQARVQFYESAFGDVLPLLDDGDMGADALVLPSSFAQTAGRSFSMPSDEGDDDPAPFRRERRSSNTDLPETAPSVDPAARLRQERRNGLWRPSV